MRECHSVSFKFGFVELIIIIMMILFYYMVGGSSSFGTHAHTQKDCWLLYCNNHKMKYNQIDGNVFHYRQWQNHHPFKQETNKQRQCPMPNAQCLIAIVGIFQWFTSMKCKTNKQKKVPEPLTQNDLNGNWLLLCPDLSQFRV